MRYAIVGVVLGTVGVVIGYALIGPRGALIGAALGPVSTALFVAVRKPARIADFLVRVFRPRSSR
ncbi:MAG: hypothetical protein ACE5LU_10450 [Anaerolineae bacterium]